MNSLTLVAFALLLTACSATRYSYREAKQVAHHNEQAVKFYQGQRRKETRQVQRQRTRQRKEQPTEGR